MGQGARRQPSGRTPLAPIKEARLAQRMKRWQVLVPVKGTTRAKTRLGDAFGPHRLRLAIAFARDTIAAAMSCGLVADVTVITGDAATVATFEGAGVRIFDDGAADGVNAAITLALLGEPRLHGSDRVAVLLGDLPALTPNALERALMLAESHDASFVPDDKGSGTTLLCARSAGMLQPRFGVTSAQDHAAVGAVQLSDSRLATLRHDVDDVDDLMLALQLGVGPHTRDVLSEIEQAAGQRLATTNGPIHS